MFPLYFLYDEWPALILRLALGAIFITHGWMKLRNLKQTSSNFEAMGFRPAGFFGKIATYLEFFGGIAIVLGLAVGPVSVLFILEFIVILGWRFSKRMPFIGGWELDLLILAAAIALFALGAGAFSIDRMLFGIL